MSAAKHLIRMGFVAVVISSSSVLYAQLPDPASSTEPSLLSRQLDCLESYLQSYEAARDLTTLRTVLGWLEQKIAYLNQLSGGRTQEAFGPALLVIRELLAPSGRGLRFRFEDVTPLVREGIATSRSALLDYPAGSQPPRFIRSDSNTDGTVTLADALHQLAFLFLDGEIPLCMQAADANDDGEVEIGDPVLVLMILFVDAGLSPDPLGVCSEDRTPDSLGCEESGTCRSAD